MKLIDADILKSHAKDVTLQNGAKHRCIDSTIICELPKIELVQCKDCEKAIEAEEFKGNKYYFCPELSYRPTGATIFYKGTFYCEHGKAKDGEHE